MTGRTISHYQVLEKLGEGGMGVVYKARDTRLDRFVALKFLPPERVSDPERKRRFIREARAASALNHPNIITIYDIDQTDGTDFIAMEYVSGRTLIETISGKPLPLKDTLDYALQIADALIGAHRAGIVHRDLKPANVMLTEYGRVKILDFGLAKLNEPAAAGQESTLTLVAGTAAYMAPEQAEGKPADARSDIYSFGAVLYEMLSGRKAFTGFTRQEPPQIRDAPADWQQIVARCLRPNPAERFQSAADLKAALEKPTTQPQSLPSIAVLPFANMSADKENEYFSDGLAEEIINALTILPGLRVAARTSSFYFRGKDLELREIGARLNVGHILEGSVRKAGDRIRVTAQLINVADGYHLWSERYDRQMTDVFAIQDDIAQAIVDKLRVQLTGPEPLIKRHTANQEAYNLYMKGRHWWNQATAGGWQKAVECFQGAIAEDHGYAPPYAGLAVAHTYISIHGWSRSRELMPRAKEYALKALALDEALAEAHWALAYFYQWYEWDWLSAEREYQRAMALSPRDAHIRIVHSCFRMYLGHTGEGLAEGRQALELDPVSEEVNRLMIYLYWLAGRYDEAVAHGQKAVELHPRGAGVRAALGVAYGFRGQYTDAIQALEHAKSLAGEDPFYDWALGYVYACQGRRSEASEIAARLNRLTKPSLSSAWLATLYGALGELDHAFELLEQAFEERDSFLIAARADPLYAPLRSDPRFPELLRRIGLEAP